MTKTTKYLSFFGLVFLTSLSLNSCKDDSKEVVPENKNTVPEFYKAAPDGEYGKTGPSFADIADASKQISMPQDLDFNKTRNNELWVLNLGTESTGGTTVIISNAGQADQGTEYRKDQNSWHFMSLPTGIAFSNNGNWATAPGIKDANHRGGTFTGPTLWSSDLNIYAKPSGGNGSHLDMLHGSPYSMGIESEQANIFGVFDGYNKHLVRYDFGADHGAGNSYHDDGRVKRYTDMELTRDPLIPSHIVLDEDKKWMYVVDGGTQRILKLDITTGSKLRNIPRINETLAEHSEITGSDWKQFVGASFGLKKPCGIEIRKDRLFVSDYETGEIICFDVSNGYEIGRINTGAKGITGIKIGPDNKIWFTNALTNKVGRVDPN